ncbi:helix-turn-helix transcriptional regulator [Priestia sp. SB1]|uniref:helix-turn-helix domain-containing protein n=1 Tax=Priestia sp. SB1 TaxID=3132359 RepID=UPI0031768290
MAYLQQGKCLLQHHLDKFGMSQVELAEKTGIHKNQISLYAKGSKGMSLTTAVAISRVLKCNAQDLYEWRRD